MMSSKTLLRLWLNHRYVPATLYYYTRPEMRVAIDDVICHVFSFFHSLQIMQAAHVDEHAQIARHVTPGLALSSGQPPFFLSRDAINYAALDYLVGLTGKVRL